MRNYLKEILEAIHKSNLKEVDELIKEEHTTMKIMF